MKRVYCAGEAVGWLLDDEAFGVCLLQTAEPRNDGKFSAVLYLDKANHGEIMEYSFRCGVQVNEGGWHNLALKILNIDAAAWHRFKEDPSSLLAYVVLDDTSLP